MAEIVTRFSCGIMLSLLVGTILILVVKKTRKSVEFVTPVLKTHLELLTFQYTNV